MCDSTYLDDILRQPETLQRGIDHGIAADVRRFLGRAGSFDRIVITGMGTSLFGAYPTFLSLARADLPVWCVESGELLHQMPELLTPRSLVWVVSQSGRSAEILALLDRLPQPAPAILATTNELESPLAARAAHVLPLHVEGEFAVSTRSYINTLAVNRLAVGAILATDGAEAELRDAPAKLRTYLSGWRDRLDELAGALHETRRLVLVGRGASYASAATGALVIKEAAKFHAEGMTAGQFRHGPLELADPDLTVLAFEGDSRTASLTARLADEVARLGARALWMGASDEVDGAIRIAAPAVSGAAMPIGEIVPVQLMSIAIANAHGHEAGAFRHQQKVTATE